MCSLLIFNETNTAAAAAGAYTRGKNAADDAEASGEENMMILARTQRWRRAGKKGMEKKWKSKKKKKLGHTSLLSHLYVS